MLRGDPGISPAPSVPPIVDVGDIGINVPGAPRLNGVGAVILAPIPLAELLIPAPPAFVFVAPPLPLLLPLRYVSRAITALKKRQ